MPELRSAVFADDIRREDNGKVLVVGAYLSEMVFPALPASVMLSTWVVLRGVPSGEGDLRLTFSFGSEVVGNADFKLNIVAPEEDVHCIVTAIPLTFSVPDSLRLTATYDGQTVEGSVSLRVTSTQLPGLSST